MGDKEVTSQDQADINAFSKLNASFHELDDELKVSKEELENLQDAQNEVMMIMDDDPVKISVGEVFIDQDQDDAMDTLTAKVEEAEASVQAKEAEILEAKDKMAVLKGRLTAKFGKSINLDEEPA